MGQPPSPACKPQALLAVVDGNPELYAALVQAYLDTVPPLMAQLLAAGGSGDAATVRKCCHDLRSSVLLFGADALSAQFALHETRARLTGATPDGAALAALAALATQVETEIRNSLPAPPHHY